MTGRAKIVLLKGYYLRDFENPAARVKFALDLTKKSILLGFLTKKSILLGFSTKKVIFDWKFGKSKGPPWLEVDFCL